MISLVAQSPKAPVGRLQRDTLEFSFVPKLRIRFLPLLPFSQEAEWRGGSFIAARHRFREMLVTRAFCLRIILKRALQFQQYSEFQLMTHAGDCSDLELILLF